MVLQSVICSGSQSFWVLYPCTSKFCTFDRCSPDHFWIKNKDHTYRSKYEGPMWHSKGLKVLISLRFIETRDYQHVTERIFGKHSFRSMRVFANWFYSSNQSLRTFRRMIHPDCKHASIFLGLISKSNCKRKSYKSDFPSKSHSGHVYAICG